jgi:hypothetical protein
MALLRALCAGYEGEVIWWWGFVWWGVVFLRRGIVGFVLGNLFLLNLEEWRRILLFRFGYRRVIG